MISLAYKISHFLSANHYPELRCVICTGVTLFAPVLHFLHWCYTWTALLSANQNRVIFSCVLLRSPHFSRGQNSFGRRSWVFLSLKTHRNACYAGYVIGPLGITGEKYPSISQSKCALYPLQTRVICTIMPGVYIPTPVHQNTAPSLNSTHLIRYFSNFRFAIKANRSWEFNSLYAITHKPNIGTTQYLTCDHLLPTSTCFEEYYKENLCHLRQNYAGVNVIPHPPHPGTRWGFVANLISNINKFPRPWGSCPPIKVLKCSHHVGLEISYKQTKCKSTFRRFSGEDLRATPVFWDKTL